MDGLAAAALGLVAPGLGSGRGLLSQMGLVAELAASTLGTSGAFLGRGLCRGKQSGRFNRISGGLDRKLDVHSRRIRACWHPQRWCREEFGWCDWISGLEDWCWCHWGWHPQRGCRGRGGRKCWHPQKWCRDWDWFDCGNDNGSSRGFQLL